MLFHDLQTSAAYWRDQPVTSAYWRGFRIWQAKAESEPLRKGQLRIAGKDSRFRLTGIILPAGNLHLIRKDITTSSKADLSRGNLHITGHAIANPSIDNPMAKGSLHLTGKDFTTQQKGTLASRVLNLTGKAATFTVSNPTHTISYIGKVGGIPVSNQTTYSSAPIATGSTDAVIVGLMRESSFGSSTTGVTLDGVSMNRLSIGNSAMFFAVASYMEYYVLSPGVKSTANIVATHSGAGTAYLHVWTITSPDIMSPLDFAVISSSGTSAVVNDIEVKNGNGFVGMIVCQNASLVSYTESWSGTDSVVEDDDYASASGNTRVGVVHLNATQTAVDKDLTFTLSTSKTYAASVVSFGLPTGWHTFAASTGNTDGTGWSGYTMRQKIKSAAISSPGGTSSRVILDASAVSGGLIIDAAYIGKGIPGTNVQCGFDSTPVQLTFGGSTSVSCGQGQRIVSDTVAFAPQSGDDVVISVHFSGASSVLYKSGVTDWESVYKNASDASNVSPSGYTTYVSQLCVSQLEGV